MTHPKEIPATRKSHLRDGVWLTHYAAVLSFELRERYRLCARTVPVSDEVSVGIVRIKDPLLGKVRQVCQLIKNKQPVRITRFAFFYRAAERAELPVKDPDHAVLRRVKDEVVDLVVAMHDPHARLAFVRQVLLIPPDELVPPRYRTYRLAALDIPHGRLRVRHFRERPDLPWEIRLVRAELFQADFVRVERG